MSFLAALGLALVNGQDIIVNMVGTHVHHVRAALPGGALVSSSLTPAAAHALGFSGLAPVEVTKASAE